MSRFLSRLHADLRRTRFSKRGVGQTYSSPSLFHKEYPRFPKTVLPAPDPLSASLQNSITKRCSLLESKKIPLTLEAWSSILQSLRVRPDGRRPYPSAGALYPIETYVVAGAMRENDEPHGIFHYHPKLHALEHIEEVAIPTDIRAYVDIEDDLQPLSLILFTSVWERSAQKYGDFAYGLALLEAGHMSQNILLSATALGFSGRPILGFNDDTLHKELRLNPEHEQGVLAIVLGHESSNL